MARTRFTREPGEPTLVASSDARASGHPLSDYAYAPPPPVSETAAAPRPGIRGRLRALAGEFKFAPAQWRVFAYGFGAALAGTLALGTVYELTGGLHWFQLSGEIFDGFFVPVLFSWWVLFFAGVAAVLRSRWAVTDAEQYAWVLIGLFFAFMAFDELLMIHERVEFHTGIDWQKLYLPIVAVGGIAYIALLRRMPRWSLEQLMWLGGAGLWIASQGLEKLEYTAEDARVPHFEALDGLEKVFQFTGSTLFLLVALLALERVISRPGPASS